MLNILLAHLPGLRTDAIECTILPSGAIASTVPGIPKGPAAKLTPVCIDLPSGSSSNSCTC